MARVDDRRVLNGIMWRFRSGATWAEVPERYGPSTTCYNRFVRWRKAGVWDRLLAAVSADYDGDLVMIDSTCVRVHQHGATGKRGDPAIVAWDVPGAVLPANSTLLSMLADVLSDCD
ncbi:transposase [Novosphingobium sp. MBES04]|nr:transposase [Novosphingobium sp. MBES04]